MALTWFQAPDHYQRSQDHVQPKPESAVVCHTVRGCNTRHWYADYPVLACITEYSTKHCTVLIAFASDRLKLRGVMMLFTLPVAIIGYAVIANVTSPSLRFGMACMMAIGMYSSVPCVLVWNSNNSAGHYKRATTSALQLAIANCGGFVASKFAPSFLGRFFWKRASVNAFAT